MKSPKVLQTADQVVELLRQTLDRHWVIGTPLGLGKPNRLLNACYGAAKADADIRLELYSALSLAVPGGAPGLQQRFLKPFAERHFGHDYPALDYLADVRRDQVPENIDISEFYMQSGTWMGKTYPQRRYLSSNYTHVARDIFFRGANVVMQLVAESADRPGHYSLAGNPDVTLDLLDRLRQSGRSYLLIAEVHPELPYMGGDAEVPATLFDAVLPAPSAPYSLYAVPRMPVPAADYRIGLYASTLVRDGGTLQIGIGTLGDAFCYFTVERQQDNTTYRERLRRAQVGQRVPSALYQEWGGAEPFESGLYAASEMFMDGLLHLHEAGVLKRRVYDDVTIQDLINQGLLQADLGPDTLDRLWQAGALPHQLDPERLEQLQELGILATGLELAPEGLRLPDGQLLSNDLADEAVRRRLPIGTRLQGGALLHAAFFLGSRWFYRKLRDMPAAQRADFQMTRVSRVNELYGGEALDRVQRQEARFINTTMKMTLLGAAVSDQLAEGQVVSGVGGQYNFVAMAHALERGRSILMLRSSHGHGPDRVSNIVWEYPHATIPRHLRDIVITEYGAADLRGKTDQEVIQSLICLADGRFQESLRLQAVAAGKLAGDWRVPPTFADNHPSRLEAPGRALPHFPFGSDFTAVEERLAIALGWLKQHTDSRTGLLKTLMKALIQAPAGESEQAALERMGLLENLHLKDRLERRLLVLALRQTDDS